MAKAFAEHLGVDVEFVLRDSIASVMTAVENRRADIAAAGLTRTDARAERFDFGPVYKRIHQQVVCGSREVRADNLSELATGSLQVVANSSYVARLEELRKKESDLDWRAVPGASTEELLRRVWRGRTDCTVADSHIVAVNRRYYPSLLVTFALSEDQSLSWLLPESANALESELEKWFAGYRGLGKRAALRERYYGYIEKFDFVDKRHLVQQIENRLPKYKHLFDQAAVTHDHDPLLLAAQAYQESHWNPQATSPTGVRGIMMLTRATARELGVKDRLDPVQSIRGGARYLDRMRERLADDIPEPDKTYLSLAAYNIGLAHLRDAQRLAKRRGKNPHDWSALRSVLPDLSRKQVYSTLRYGYARGFEPVRYVRRIRDYADVIARRLD